MKNGNILKVSLEGQGVNIVVYLNVKMQEMFRMYVFHWVKLMLDHWSFWDSVFENSLWTWKGMKTDYINRGKPNKNSPPEPSIGKLKNWKKS